MDRLATAWVKVLVADLHQPRVWAGTLLRMSGAAVSRIRRVLARGPVRGRRQALAKIAIEIETSASAFVHGLGELEGRLIAAGGLPDLGAVSAARRRVVAQGNMLSYAPVTQSHSYSWKIEVSVVAAAYHNRRAKRHNHWYCSAGIVFSLQWLCWAGPDVCQSGPVGRSLLVNFVRDKVQRVCSIAQPAQREIRRTW